MSVDSGDLTRRWGQVWPECPPIGYLFRHRMHDRWVRFHSLAFGRRYPTSAAEYREVLMRHNAVLVAVLSESRSAEIYLVTVEYGAGDMAAGTEPIHAGLHPGAVPWMQAVDPDDPEVAYGLHVSRQQFTPGDLDDLLRYIADDRASEVVIADQALRWLLHPYDGGMDVIAPSVEERDRLAARFGRWLSDRPDGL
jgi:hypothetical protein